MSTNDRQLYIDAVIVKGIGRILTCSIEQLKEEAESNVNPDLDSDFEPIDLSPYIIRFRVLGSADGNGVVLLEKNISQETNPTEIGVIKTNENAGEFSIAITAEDTDLLGIGDHPISIEILDEETLETVYTLTEGGIAQGEFNHISIVRT